jgi:hypothetical protein
VAGRPAQNNVHQYVFLVFSVADLSPLTFLMHNASLFAFMLAFQFV